MTVTKKSVNLRLDEDLLTQITQHAASMHISVQQYLREAVQRRLDAEKTQRAKVFAAFEASQTQWGPLLERLAR
jgi:predicted transcriptional regulator